MSLYDDMLAAHGTPAAALEAMRTELGYASDRSLWRSEVEQWRQAAEGWQAQTDREVAWRERLLAENTQLRAELERERHDAWIALDGTNVKALKAEVEALRSWIDTEGRNCPSASVIDAILRPVGEGEQGEAATHKTLATSKKGEVYKHTTLRGQWTVRSCGPTWITLIPSIPYLHMQRIPTASFVVAGWERVR